MEQIAPLAMLAETRSMTVVPMTKPPGPHRFPLDPPQAISPDTGKGFSTLWFTSHCTTSWGSRSRGID
jgi:hypothetical protein